MPLTLPSPIARPSEVPEPPAKPSQSANPMVMSLTRGQNNDVMSLVTALISTHGTSKIAASSNAIFVKDDLTIQVTGSGSSPAVLQASGGPRSDSLFVVENSAKLFIEAPSQGDIEVDIGTGYLVKLMDSSTGVVGNLHFTSAGGGVRTFSENIEGLWLYGCTSDNNAVAAYYLYTGGGGNVSFWDNIFDSSTGEGAVRLDSPNNSNFWGWRNYLREDAVSGSKKSSIAPQEGTNLYIWNNTLDANVGIGPINSTANNPGGTDRSLLELNHLVLVENTIIGDVTVEPGSYDCLVDRNTISGSMKLILNGYGEDLSVPYDFYDRFLSGRFTATSLLLQWHDASGNLTTPVADADGVFDGASVPFSTQAGDPFWDLEDDVPAQGLSGLIRGLPIPNVPNLDQLDQDSRYKLEKYISDLHDYIRKLAGLLSGRNIVHTVVEEQTGGDLVTTGVLTTYATTGSVPSAGSGIVGVHTTNVDGASSSFARVDHQHQGVSGFKTGAGAAEFGEITVTGNTWVDVSNVSKTFTIGLSPTPVAIGLVTTVTVDTVNMEIQVGTISATVLSTGATGIVTVHTGTTCA